MDTNGDGGLRCQALGLGYVNQLWPLWLWWVPMKWLISLVCQSFRVQMLSLEVSVLGSWVTSLSLSLPPSNMLKTLVRDMLDMIMMSFYWWKSLPTVRSCPSSLKCSYPTWCWASLKIESAQLSGMQLQNVHAKSYWVIYFPFKTVTFMSFMSLHHLGKQCSNDNYCCPPELTSSYLVQS